MDRDVRIRILAEVNQYKRQLQDGAVTTSRFGREIDSLDGSLTRMESSSQRAGSEIDQLSGRLRVALDLAAIIGPSVAPISAVAIPALVGMTAQLGAAASAGGVLMLALSGMGDGLKALNEYQLDKTPENLAKLREEFERLGPAGAKFIQYIDSITPQLKELQLVARDNMLPGLEDSIERLLTRGPEVGRLIGTISRAVGDLAEEGAAGLAGDDFDEFFEYLQREGAPLLTDLGRTIGNVTAGVAELIQTFDPLTNDMSKWLLDAARGFHQWADGLENTAGWVKFVDYVRTSGPQVAAAFGSIANMVVSLAQAIAPLGGTSLKILETAADVISTIADSDLGTPLIAGLAALAAYNRVLAITVKLQEKAATSPRSAAGVVGGNISAQVDGLKALPGAYREVAAAQAELSVAQGRSSEATRTYVSQLQVQNRLQAEGYKMSTTAQARLTDSLGRLEMANYGVQSATERVHAAESKRSGLMRRTAAEAGKAGAAVGGLALATSGLADGMGLGNTASMALMGTIAGPWGAALGGGVGLLMDWRANSQEASNTAAEFTATLDAQTGAITENTRALASKKLEDSGALEAAESLGLSLQLVTDAALGNEQAQGQLNAALSAYSDEAATATGGGKGSFVAGAYSDDANAAGLLSGKVAEVAGALSSSKEAADRNAEAMGVAATSTNSLRRAYDSTANAADGLTDSLEDLDGLLGKRSSYRSYQGALDDLKKSLKDAPKAWSAFTEAGRTNLDNLDSIVSNATRHVEELTNPKKKAAFLDDVIGQLRGIASASPAAAREVGKILPALKDVRDANKRLVISVDNADAMKKAKVAQLALRELNTMKPRPVVTVEPGNSFNILANIRAGLAAIKSKSVTVTVNRGAGARADIPLPGGGSAPAPTVPRKAPPTVDPREADRSGPLYDVIRDTYAARTVADPDEPKAGDDEDGKPKDKAGDKDGDKTRHALQIFIAGIKGTDDPFKVLKRRLQESEKALDRERQQRDDLVAASQAFAAAVGGAYAKVDLLEGSLADFDTGLAANTNDTNAANAALDQAALNGLDGALYQALASSGNLALLEEFAALSAEQIQIREDQFAAQGAAQTGLGAESATREFAEAIKAQNKDFREAQQERKRMAHLVQQVENRLDKLPDKVEEGARKGVSEKDKTTRAQVRTTDQGFVKAGRR